VYYDKQKVLIDRPRLRSKNNKEFPLPRIRLSEIPEHEELNNEEYDSWHLEPHYAESVESFVKGYGIKKSSVSRHFVKATAEQMREFMERTLAGLTLLRYSSTA